ncbi:MAG: hypothetical protein K5Q68_15725 [Roseococcus sp.]|nr:hypothetical protein [Roseococcus sp.]
MSDGDQPRPLIPWLSRATLAAARAARRPDVLTGTTSRESKAVRDVVLAHHPALPATMITEAVAYVLGSE